jgi:hypothetical protein
MASHIAGTTGMGHHTQLLFSFFLLLFWVGVHCGIYKSSYNTSNVSYLNSPPPPFSFKLPSPIPGEFQQVSFFSFTYMCTQYLPIFTFPHPFPISSPSHYTKPSGRTCSAPLFSNFVKEKK